MLLGISLSGAVAAGAQEREATPAVVNPAIASRFRATIRLGGTWEFAVDPGKVGDGQKWFRPDVPLPGRATIEVPGCWEAQGVGGPGKSRPVTPERSIRSLRGSYVGTAWYRRTVAVPADWSGKQVWLKIGGVHAQGWFWVNGAYLGRNACYCGAYKYNVTDLVKPGEKAVIVAKVANDVPSGKGLMGWIARFGGLYRDVEIEATPAVSLDDAYVVGDLDRKTATVHVALRCTGPPAAAGQRQVEVAVSTLDGVPAGRDAAKVPFGGGEIEELSLEVPLDPFQSWSPEQPRLYTAEIVLKAEGKPVDGWVERFGVRKWEVRGSDFYLNNRKYFIRGFGDDCIYPLTLCPPASRGVHRQHLALAKQYGFVYVRHHTHCEVPEFFEAADELGVMVQPELPYYGPAPSAGARSSSAPKRT